MKNLLSTAEDILSDDDRTRIAALADVIVPAFDDKPSASDAGVHTRTIDRALAARPDLIQPLRDVLDRASRDGVERALADLGEDALPVVNLIVASYYMTPRARRAIDYQGQAANPIAEGEAEYYLEEDNVLESVLQRGRLWRSTPDDPTSV